MSSSSGRLWSYLDSAISPIKHTLEELSIGITSDYDADAEAHGGDGPEIYHDDGEYNSASSSSSFHLRDAGEDEDEDEARGLLNDHSLLREGKGSEARELGDDKLANDSSASQLVVEEEDDDKSTRASPREQHATHEVPDYAQLHEESRLGVVSDSEPAPHESEPAPTPTTTLAQAWANLGPLASTSKRVTLSPSPSDADSTPRARAHARWARAWDASRALIRRGKHGDKVGAPKRVAEQAARTSQRTLSAEDVIADTLRMMPVQPDRITNVDGPVLELSRVDDTSNAVDVTIKHSFRAHFDARTLPKNTMWALPPTPDGSAPPSFSALLLEGPRGDVDEDSSGSMLTTHAGTNDDDARAHDLMFSPEFAYLRIDSESISYTRDCIGPHNRLGIGGYGEVYKGVWRGTPVAVKRLFDQRGAGQEVFASEVSILSRLRHPRVVLWMGVIVEPQNLSIVMEYMDRGSLADVVHKMAPDGRTFANRLTTAMKMSWAHDIVEGMAYLHGQHIVHRDLTSNNVLMNKKGQAKITDFGLSKVKNSRHSNGTSSAKKHGAAYYCAPEALRNDPYDYPCDVFSFGVILWELMHRQRPFDGVDIYPFIASVQREGTRYIRSALEWNEAAIVGVPQVKDIALRCWLETPRDRPAFQELVGELVL